MSKKGATTQVPMPLLLAAQRVARNAHAPYSRFLVGSAAKTLKKRVYASANIENASYGLTICAEVGALQQAMSFGDYGKITDIAVVGGPITRSKAARPIVLVPCGRCRQLIQECAHWADREIRVWCASMDLTVIKMYLSSELLPDSFDRRVISNRRYSVKK